jgi:ribonucleotide monophosphatase NagD (HAD superfamily)
MITNGGGVTEAERCRALSAELDVEVCRPTYKADEEIGPDQLVQSHTPLKDYVGDLADKPVLILGGVGEAGRRIAKSYDHVKGGTDDRYGLNQAYILQDLIAWQPSIWDRYMLTEEERSFVKVSRSMERELMK